MNEEWHEYYVYIENALVVRAKWRMVGPDAELHNEAYSSTKSVLVLSRRVLCEYILPDMRTAGVRYAIAIDYANSVDSVRKHYWRFMGFKFFGECEAEGNQYSFAGMEVL